MELSARLSAQLSLLALDVQRDGAGLTDGVATLVSTLTASVSGFAALRLTLVHTGQPVQLTALVAHPGDPPAVSSLRVTLPLATAEAEDGGRLVVWSSRPGSLEDLGADLAHVLTRGSAGDGPPAVQLDVDLPVPALRSGVEGVAELSSIHRAAGLLIEEGRDPGSVYDVLRREASQAGVTTLVWADRLLRAVSTMTRGGAARPGPGERIGDDAARR